MVNICSLVGSTAHTSHDQNYNFGQSYITFIQIIWISLHSILENIGKQDTIIET
jgi:hypothetical protein